MRRFTGLSIVLLTWSAVANLVIGDRFYVSRNLLLSGGLLGLAWWWGATRRDLGLPPSRVGAGLRWGAASAVVVAGVLTLAVVYEDALGPLAALLADQRAQLSGPRLRFAVLVRIPLGTALFEELAFRGVLLATLLRVTSPTRAVLGSSVVFGLWHVAPTVVTLRLNDIPTASLTGVGAIVGGVLVTTVAGVVFAWLRLASGSVLAPVLAHWATNALGLLAAARAGGSLGG